MFLIEQLLKVKVRSHFFKMISVQLRFLAHTRLLIKPLNTNGNCVEILIRIWWFRIVYLNGSFEHRIINLKSILQEKTYGK